MSRLAGMLAIALLTTTGMACMAESPGGQVSLRLLLEEHERVKANWNADIEADRSEDAVAKAERLVKLQRQLIDQAPQETSKDFDQLDEFCDALSDTLNWLADRFEETNGFDKVVSLRQQIVALKNGRIERDESRRNSSLTPEQLSQVEKAGRLYAEGEAQFKAHKIDEAIETFTTGLQFLEATLGEEHRETQKTRGWIPYLHKLRGDYLKAKPFYERTVALNEKTFGEHPVTAKSLHALALLCERMGEFDEAELRFRQSLEMRQRIWGDQPWRIALAHNELGRIRMWTGNYAGAKPQLERSFEIVSKLPESDRDLGANLQNQALLHQMMGDYAVAEPLYRRALEHAKRHKDVAAQVFDNLGLMYAAVGDEVAAESSFQRALETYKGFDSVLLNKIVDFDDSQPDELDIRFHEALDSIKNVHPATLRSIARTQSNFAWLLTSIGEHEKAERLYKRSLAINKAVGGDQRPEAAACLDNLGWLHQKMGDLRKSEGEYRRALAIRRKVLGGQHIETAVSLSNLGVLELLGNDREKAQELLHDCLLIRRQVLDKTATVQNERQQLLMNQNLRSALDDWLSVVDDETAYGEVLRWKGTVFVRQAALRSLRRHPELKTLVDNLRSLSSQLAKLSLMRPEKELQQQHLEQLSQVATQRDELDSQLAEKSQAYRRVQRDAALTPSALQEVIARNENTALVDVLEYHRVLSGEQGGDLNHPTRQRRFVAFVICASGPVRRVELGSAEKIDQLVEDYRSNHLIDKYGSNVPGTPAGRSLRELVWLPIEEHLSGIDTVLVSPDGSLSRLPLATLPGRKPESYLLEDYVTAVIPVPQAMPSLLASEIAEVERDVLVLGGVNYDAKKEKATGSKSKFARSKFARSKPVPSALDGRTPSESSRTETSYATRMQKWPALEASGEELTLIKRKYETNYDLITTLEGSDATEEAFREQAPRHRVLHLATHGFFAGEEQVSSLQNRGPNNRSGADANGFLGHDAGLLSGIVLAGANQPRADGDDGVLTALEVAEMDLAGVDLAILSACETGLGRVAGGEGLLGLQRAFQVAGARSVVASLWRVPDSDTRDLMKGFHNNFWNTDMGKIEALHNAQLSILQGEDQDRGQRVSGKESVVQNPRTPPYYWGAFVLSGDWR